MRTIKFLAFGLLAGVLFTGCCNCNKKSVNYPFQETVWQLTKLNDKTVQHDNNFTISFLNTGRISGKGACNTFFGPWEFTKDNNGIKIGPVASTMMACPNMDVESEFFKLLEEVTSYRAADSKLYLYVGNSQRAVLEGTSKKVR